MGFIISINGADFVPYSIVHNPSPLVRKARSSQEVHKLDGEQGHSDSFEDVLIATPPKKMNRYQESLGNSEKTPKKIVYAKELMISPVITLTTEATVSQAQELLKNHDIRHIPIVDSENTLIGIISDRSLMLADKSTAILRVMNQKIIAAEANIRLQEIAKVMLDNRINSIPIVDDSRRLIGIITSSDIIRSVFKNPNVDLWA